MKVESKPNVQFCRKGNTNIKPMSCILVMLSVGIEALWHPSPHQKNREAKKWQIELAIRESTAHDLLHKSQYSVIDESCMAFLTYLKCNDKVYKSVALWPKKSYNAVVFESESSKDLHAWWSQIKLYGFLENTNKSYGEHENYSMVSNTTRSFVALKSKKKWSNPSRLIKGYQRSYKLVQYGVGRAVHAALCVFFSTQFLTFTTFQQQKWASLPISTITLNFLEEINILSHSWWWINQDYYIFISISSVFGFPFWGLLS